jgi:phosphomevalonate kinase
LLGDSPLGVINGISQVANLASQNKIGSNFDISTAVYGTHLYINIIPKIAFQVLSNNDLESVISVDA